MAIDDCLDDFGDRLLDDGRRVERDPVFESRAETTALSRAISAATPRWTSSALAVGQRQDAEADGVDALEAQQRGIGFGAELDGADVAQADERAIVAGLDDDVLELACSRAGVRPRAR